MSEWASGNRYLSKSEMENNASLIWAFLGGKGWTKEAVAGLLGNFEKESSVNPGIWQDLTENYQAGYGLAQWTPATKYIDWAGSGWQGNGNKQLQRLIYEKDNGIQWITTSAYPLEFSEFTTSTRTPEYLAYVWMYNYERPADYDQPERKSYARAWYNYLRGEPTPPPTPTPGGKLPVWLLKKLSERR